MYADGWHPHSALLVIGDHRRTTDRRSAGAGWKASSGRRGLGHVTDDAQMCFIVSLISCSSYVASRSAAPRARHHLFLLSTDVASSPASLISHQFTLLDCSAVLAEILIYRHSTSFFREKLHNKPNRNNVFCTGELRLIGWRMQIDERLFWRP